MTPFAVLRHGPTAWNGEGRLQGRADRPLGEAGARAVAAWRLPAAVAGFTLVSSPLARAVATARILLPDAALRLDDRLVEMDWGAWEGRTLAELRAADPAGMAAGEARGLDLLPPGGESPRAVIARLAPLLAECAAAGEPVLAVAHKGVIRALFAWATGWDMTGKPPVRLDWQSVHLFALECDGRPRPDRLNLSLLS